MTDKLQTRTQMLRMLELHAAREKELRQRLRAYAPALDLKDFPDTWEIECPDRVYLNTVQKNVTGVGPDVKVIGMTVIVRKP